MHHSSQALFRFAVISQVLARSHGGEMLTDAVRAVAARDHVGFDGSLARVSQRSIYRWLAAYRAQGMAGLEPRRHNRSAPSEALPREFVEFLIHEKRQDSEASIPELIRRATERGILKPQSNVDRSTAYRAAKRLGLSLARRKRAKDRDSRRFAFPHRLDMVLCDGKHFRAGEQRQKRVALFYLDDATRYVLHLVVGTSETAELFQRGLYECIARYGYMSALYLDRGPGFIADDTIGVLANLGIPLIHGETGYKEGRGKIERFNRTIKADVLRGLRRPEVDPACGSLVLRLRHYTDRVYAHHPHESLGKETPWHRFSTDPKPLRFPEDRQTLEAKFEIWIQRRVSNDHVVSIDSIDYEMPRGYAGQIVTLRRKLLHGTIGFVHDGRLIDLRPVDPAANARAPRARGADEPQPMPPITAAELSFRRDFGPIVDRDGGFHTPSSDDDEPKETNP